ncbi:MAG TPA: septum formation initiator family protein [Gemmatimonadaceae bacterium]|nr:septum formation initiator family protein [Gemmatimonadaceae bacterium]
MARQKFWQRIPARRALLIVGALGVAYFAIEGGEYGTSDLIRQRIRRTRLQSEIDSIQLQIDSLDRYRKQILTDPVLQERIAREQFGMVRGDKELVYRFTDPTTKP